jgi:hypothetical protein
VRDADTIVVVHEGRAVEQGTHDELMALGGAYCALVAAQLGTQQQRPDAATPDAAIPMLIDEHKLDVTPRQMVQAADGKASIQLDPAAGLAAESWV